MRPISQLAALLVAFGLVGGAASFVVGRADATPRTAPTPDLVMIALAFGPALKLVNEDQIGSALAHASHEPNGLSKVFACARTLRTSLFSIGLTCRRVRYQAAR